MKAYPCGHEFDLSKAKPSISGPPLGLNGERMTGNWVDSCPVCDGPLRYELKNEK